MAKSRGIAFSAEGLGKVRQRMSELPKPNNPEKKRWSQQDLVVKTGLGDKTVQRALKRELLDRATIITIADALGLEPASLVNPSDWSEEPRLISEEQWRQVCRKMVPDLSSNALTQGQDLVFDRQAIYVPLGLVERVTVSLGNRHSSQDREDPSEKRQSREQERVKSVTEAEFFGKALGQGQTAKSQGKRVAIIGEAGSGKTTRLQAIADWVLSERVAQGEVPIWVSLGLLGDKSLREYVLEDWLRNASGELVAAPEEWVAALQELLDSGKVWLLLDGVDEMGISDPLQKVAQQLGEGWLRSVRVVLTCRVNVWEVSKNALYKFDVFKNLDFEPSQVDLFIDRWFTNNPEQSSLLKSVLAEPGRENLQDLVRSPLRLVMLCSIWQGGNQSLPRTSSELYQYFIEYLYQWYKPGVSAAQKQTLEEAIGQLALNIIEQSSSGQLFFSEADALKSMGEDLVTLAKEISLINVIRLNPLDSSKSIYGFYHASFGDYYAALAVQSADFWLVHNAQNPWEGVYRVFEDKWERVILEWIESHNTLVSEKSELLDRIHEFLRYEDSIYWIKALLKLALIMNEANQSHQGLDTQSPYELLILDLFSPLTDELKIHKDDADKFFVWKEIQLVSSTFNGFLEDPVILSIYKLSDFKKELMILLQKTQSLGNKKAIQDKLEAIFETGDSIDLEAIPGILASGLSIDRDRLVKIIDNRIREKVIESEIFMTISVENDQNFLKVSQELLQCLSILNAPLSDQTWHSISQKVKTINDKDILSHLIHSFLSEDGLVHEKNNKSAIKVLLIILQEIIPHINVGSGIFQLPVFSQNIVIDPETGRCQEWTFNPGHNHSYKDFTINEHCLCLLIKFSHQDEELTDHVFHYLQSLYNFSKGTKLEESEISEILKSQETKEKSRLTNCHSFDPMSCISMKLSELIPSFAPFYLKSMHYIDNSSVAKWQQLKHCMVQDFIKLLELINLESANGIEYFNCIIEYISLVSPGNSDLINCLKNLYCCSRNSNHKIFILETLLMLTIPQYFQHLDDLHEEIYQFLVNLINQDKWYENKNYLDAIFWFSSCQFDGTVYTDLDYQNIIEILHRSMSEMTQKNCIRKIMYSSLIPSNIETIMTSNSLLYKFLIENKYISIDGMTENIYWKLGLIDDFYTCFLPLSIDLINMFSNAYIPEMHSLQIPPAGFSCLPLSQTNVDLLDKNDFYNLRQQCFTEIQHDLNLYIEEATHSVNADEFPENHVFVANLKTKLWISLIWAKTKDMAYPEFWQAWNQPQTSIHPEMAEITPIGSTPQTQQLNNQLLNLSTQLSPTATTHPLCLNLSGLQTLSDRAELCQALALLSYEAIDPSFDTLDIPENIHTPTQLKTALLKLRKYLKTPEIAIIIHNSDPTPEILDILTVLSPSFPIAWITDQPHPHRSFLPTAANLPQLLQTWLTRS